MKKLLIIALLLLPSIVSAQFTVPQGGTGKTSFPLGGWIYSQSNLRLAASSSPTVGWLTATSTATSTFAGGIQAGDFCTSLRCLSSVSTGAGLNYWTNAGDTTTLNTGSVAEAGSFVATSTTATSTFANALNVANHLYVGGLDFLSDNGFSPVANDIAHFFRSIDDYTAVILGNLSSGTSASSDLIFNNDATNDAGGYVVDIGYNSSNYDVIDYGLQNVPNMSYWYNTDGPISIATASTSPDAYIQFLTGGFNDEAMRIENTGNVTIGGIASEGYKLNVEGDVQFQNPDWTDAYIRMNSGAIAVKSSDNSLMNFSNVLTLSSNSTITADTEEDIVIRSGNTGGDFDIKLLPGIGNVGIGTTSPYSKLSVVGTTTAAVFEATTTATSTSNGGWNITSGCFAISGTCIGGGSGSGVTGGTAGMLAAFVDATTLTATSAPTAGYYVATSSTASAFKKLTLTPLSVGTSLDILDGSASGSIRLGADVNNSTRSSNVRKLASITAPDYGNTRNIEFISSDSDSSGTNKVYLGGRTSASTYAATDLYLNTATNPSTTGGTTAVYINSTGHMGIGTTTLLSNTKLTLAPTATNVVPLGIKGVTSQSSNFVEIKNSAGTTMTRISPAGGVLIGSGAGAGYTYASPNAPQLDISWGGVPNAFILGAENNLSTRTHNTTKVGRIALAPYSTNALALNIFGGSSNVSSNLLTFGGGTSVLQAATQVDFYTSAATNTPTGTSRMTIINTGKVGIHLTTPDTEFQVSTSTLARATAGTVELLKLSLPLNSGVSYPQAASFALGTYSSNSVANGYGPDTRLDIKLKTTSASDYLTDLTVMSFLDNGNIGIGTSTPTTNLQINGTTATSTLSATVVNGATRSTTLGGKIILQDMAGGTCTEITTQSGAISSRAVTCP